MDDLTNLRKIAEEATQGSWEHWNPSVGESHIAIANKVAWRSLRSATQFADDEKIPHWADATHIATFDPPTVLALIDRLEQAEQSVARVREVADNARATKHESTEYLHPLKILRALDGER